MIYGIGVDTASCARIAGSLARPGFLQRVYSEAERALIEGRGGKRRIETAAANFAAKEAFLKALGTGLSGGALADISALRDGQGAPYLALEGAVGQLCREKGLTAHLSLTHEADFATAFVVLERSGARVVPL